MNTRHLPISGFAAVCLLVSASAGDVHAYDCRRAQDLVREARAISDNPAARERTLREADRLCPNYGEPSLLLGDLYKEQGDLTRARQAYARAGVAEPQDLRSRDRIVDLRAPKPSASLAPAGAAAAEGNNFPQGTRVVRERVGGVEVIRPAIPDEALGGAVEDAVPSRAAVTVEGGVQVIRPFRPGVKPEGAETAGSGVKVTAEDLAAMASLIEAADTTQRPAPSGAAGRSERIEIITPSGYEAAEAEGAQRIVEIDRRTQTASLAPDLAAAAAAPAPPAPKAPEPPAQDSAAACARAEELYKEGVALSDGSIREEFAYQKAIEACPSHAESRNALGVVYVIQKKWGMAESEFRRATDLKPDFAKAWFNLGSLYEQSGEFTRAIDAFLAAIDADKSYVKSYPRLANLYLRFGNEEAAIQHYERMLQVGDDADAHYQLGVLYWKKGDKPRAGGHIQQAVKLNPDLLNKPEAGQIISAAF